MRLIFRGNDDDGSQTEYFLLRRKKLIFFVFPNFNVGIWVWTSQFEPTAPACILSRKPAKNGKNQFDSDLLYIAPI